MNELKPMQIVWCDGCFTQEYSLKGKTLKQIFVELGLPDRRLHEGAYIVYSLWVPRYNQFELGGHTKHSTEKFITYGEKGAMNWNKTKFLETYPNHRFNQYLREGMTGWNRESVEKKYGEPINSKTIETVKREWLKINNNRKLLKVLPGIRHKDGEEYPSGGRANQIILKENMKCQVVGKYLPNDVFHGVW